MISQRYFAFLKRARFYDKILSKVYFCRRQDAARQKTECGSAKKIQASLFFCSRLSLSLQKLLNHRYDDPETTNFVCADGVRGLQLRMYANGNELVGRFARGTRRHDTFHRRRASIRTRTDCKIGRTLRMITIGSMIVSFDRLSELLSLPFQGIFRFTTSCGCRV